MLASIGLHIKTNVNLRSPSFPELGAIYAATGHMSLLQATESAGRLDTPHVIINTLLRIWINCVIAGSPCVA